MKINIKNQNYFEKTYIVIDCFDNSNCWDKTWVYLIIIIYITDISNPLTQYC